MGRHSPISRVEDLAPAEVAGRAWPRRRRGGRGVGLADPVDRKAMQLCHQVAVTLNEVLADCADPVLQGLQVVNVEPAPDASRLSVALACDDDQALSRVEDHLARASGHLRAEVAQAVTRKRAPMLVYHIAAAPG
ncbi:ribosome-binding factor A [Paludisphaera sp.]|uniref:ribosome-binding factor A n=1 Tax=Paludisphaera sp. TaxID=2017432 RepID=UPI00301CF1DA